MAEFLVFDHIRKHFGPVQAVDDVSLEIKRGEFFSLLGPSGCGKTTMLRMVGRVRAARRRAAFFWTARDITDLPPHRRRVNTIFQSYALFPHLSVRDNIAFGLQIAKRPKREIDREVEAMLHLIQMEDQADKKPDQLSGRPEAARGHRPRARQQARRCSCSTSRWPPSTSSCASACSSSST